MTIMISRVEKNTAMGEQWRVLVVRGEDEIYHDTSCSAEGAAHLLGDFLLQDMEVRNDK